MKVELKMNSNGFCDYFKIDGKEFGQSVNGLDIKIRAGEMPEIILKANSDEFILDNENNKLYLEKKPEKEE